MNKMTKGALATALGVALLVVGGGTLTVMPRESGLSRRFPGLGIAQSNPGKIIAQDHAANDP